MQERADALIRQGQAAAQAGQQELARRYLQAAVELEPNNAEAWLWLSGVQDLADARTSLRKVLELEPGNARARDGLAWVEQQIAANPQIGGGTGRTGGLGGGTSGGTGGLSGRGASNLGGGGGLTGALRAPSDPSVGGGGGRTGALRRPAGQAADPAPGGGTGGLSIEQELRSKMRGGDSGAAPAAEAAPAAPAGPTPLTRTTIERSLFEQSMMTDVDPGLDEEVGQIRILRIVFFGLVGLLGVGILVLILALINII